jgi:hypothetical protein
MVNLTLKPLEGTTGVFLITASLGEGPVLRSQIHALTGLEALEKFRSTVLALSAAPFPEVQCN